MNYKFYIYLYNNMNYESKYIKYKNKYLNYIKYVNTPENLKILHLWRFKTT